MTPAFPDGTKSCCDHLQDCKQLMCIHRQYVLLCTCISALVPCLHQKSAMHRISMLQADKPSIMLQAKGAQNEAQGVQPARRQDPSPSPALLCNPSITTVTATRPAAANAEAAAAAQQLPPHFYHHADQPVLQPLQQASSDALGHLHPQQAQQQAAGSNPNHPQPARHTGQEHSLKFSAWQGQLAKSGLLKCKAECLSVGLADHPLPFPAVLDVRARVVVSHALDLPKQHAPQHMVVRCIVPTKDPKNAEEFHVFCQYLSEKHRAGVVNLGSRAVKHDLFLVPGAPDVYQQLHMQDPHQECLVAITTAKQ